MTHVVEKVGLMSPGPGTTRSLTVHRFGARGTAPKVYMHAALHADELPGTLILNRMLGWLKDADERGEVLGEVVVVPYANPVGLANHIYGYHLGRYDLDGDGNFNRWYPDLSKKIAKGIGNALGDDEEANGRVIRTAALNAVDEWNAEGEANTLRKALMALSIDADIVLDLHCHGEAVQYLYLPDDYWESHADLPAELGCEVVLLYPTNEGATFDVAPTLYWHHLAAAFPDRPIPRAPFTATIELRGQQDVNDGLAEQDARALWRFLQRHGALAGDPGPAPVLRCQPTPVDGVDHATAPHAGVLNYHVKVGARMKQGDTIADIVDPAEADFDKARTAVRVRTDGIFFGRNLSMLVRPGQSFASVAGPEVLPEPDLPFIDY